MQKKNCLFLLFFLALFSCRTYTINDQYQGKLVDYSSAKPDSGIQELIKPYSQVYQSSMNEVVGYLGQDMEKGFPEGALGNFFADIFLDYVLEHGNWFSPDNTFALFNNGGLRVPLQKGPVTRGKIFEFMPFENMLVAVELKGKHLVNEMADYILSKKGQPVSRNVKIEFRNNQLVSMEINGKPVDTARTYMVLTSDYLLSGGDNMAFFKKGELLDHDMVSVKLRDGVIDCFMKHSTQQKPLQAPGLGRIKME